MDEDMKQFVQNFSEDQLKIAVNEIKKSNLSMQLRSELAELLETVNTQIKDAKAKGLLP